MSSKTLPYAAEAEQEITVEELEVWSLPSLPFLVLRSKIHSREGGW
jgi:hypothetical protein